MPGQKTNAVVIRKNERDLRNRNSSRRIGTIVPVLWRGDQSGSCCFRSSEFHAHPPLRIPVGADAEMVVAVRKASDDAAFEGVGDEQTLEEQRRERKRPPPLSYSGLSRGPIVPRVRMPALWDGRATINSGHPGACHRDPFLTEARRLRNDGYRRPRSPPALRSGPGAPG